MHRLSAMACLLLALVAPPPASADQNDPRLDELFSRLRAAEDRQAVDRLTRQIWRAWRSHEDPRVTLAMAQGGRAMAGREFARAEYHFGRAVELAPDYSEGWNQRATVRYLRGRFAQSAADIRRVLMLEPRHFGALEGLGLIYLELGQEQAALDTFERALRINPHLSGSRAQIERLRDRDGGDDP